MRWWGGYGQPWVPCLKIVDLPSLGNLVNLVNLNTVQRDATRKPLLHLGQALVLLRQLLLHHHVLLVVDRPCNQLLPVLSSHVSLQLLRQGETLQAHLARVSGKFLLDRECRHILYEYLGNIYLIEKMWAMSQGHLDKDLAWLDLNLFALGPPESAWNCHLYSS